jgi:hypothetical protein
MSAPAAAAASASTPVWSITSRNADTKASSIASADAGTLRWFHHGVDFRSCQLK